MENTIFSMCFKKEREASLSFLFPARRAGDTHTPVWDVGKKRHGRLIFGGVMRIRWDLVPIIARFCRGGNGEPGPEIFRRMTGPLGHEPRDTARAMREYGYGVKRARSGDYWVSDSSTHFPSPMKLDKD